nr:restriction endonuclease subunit S [uncultured Flavobacterium sp.]
MSTATLNIEKKKTLIPQLRFQEFKDVWKNKTLSEVANKITDGTHDTPKPTKDGIPFLTAIHIKDGFVDYNNCYYLDQEVHNSIYKRCNPEKDDLLIVNIGAGTATCAINTVDYEFSLKNVALVKPNKEKLDGNFLAQVQRKKTSKIFNQLTSGGAQPFLSLKEIGRLKISLPPLQEQQKIASFLSAVDEKIQQLSRKKELLEEYKKGVMQQLFSGKLRFKDENGKDYPDWEEKKLGDVLKIGSGKDYKHLEKGNIPVFGTGGYMLSVNKFLYSGETVFIGRKGTIDKPFYFNGEFWTVDTLFYTHSFKSVIPKFIYCVFRQINWKLHNEASGVPSLSKSTIEKLNFNFPCIQEQQKIANFLSSIDTKIESVNQQLAQTQTFKKGLLQQMFV